MKKAAFILAALAVVCMVVGAVDAKPKKEKKPGDPAKPKKERVKLTIVRGTLVEATKTSITIKPAPARKKKGKDAPPAEKAPDAVTLEIGEKTQIRIDKDKVGPKDLANPALAEKPVIAAHKPGEKVALKIMVRTKAPEKKPRGDKKPDGGKKPRKGKKDKPAE